MKNRILIIIDMINDFVKEGGALYFKEGEAIIPAIKKRIDEYKKNDLTMIFLSDSHLSDDKEFDLFSPHAIRNTDGAEIVKDLFDASSGGDVRSIPKTGFNGFYRTSLTMLLDCIDYKAAKKSTLEIVGVCTSICIMDTVGAAVERDWKVEIPTNCVADFDPDNHTGALIRMSDLYGVKLI